jgi:lysozyme
LNKLRVFLAALGLTAAAAVTPLVIDHEGVVLKTYPDPIGIPTACIGETGPHIQYGQVYTHEQCMDMLRARLEKEWAGVSACIKREITLKQAMALLSWTYNVGVTAACKSTLMRLLNAGEPAAVWCKELLRWTKAKGRELPGLVRRRRDEYEVCIQ